MAERAGGRAGRLSVAAEPVGSPEATALRTAFARDVWRTIAGTLPGEGFLASDAGLVAPDGAFWVARLDRAPVGCVGARALGEGDVEVKRFYVDPAARGSGAATALMGALEAWSRARGATRLVLDTRPELAAATAFYRRAGWVEVEPYNDNPDARLWFAKPLSP